MADNTELNPGSGGDIAATDDIAGVKYQRVKLTLGADGVNDGDLSGSNPMPVAGSLSVDNFPAQIGLTDDQLRAAPVPTVDAEAGSLLGRILRALLSPLGYDMSIQRYRQTAVVESGTITAVTTVATLTNQANIGGVQAQLLVNGQNVSAWQACVRSRIT
jgi:hypothetical protein